jgi:hypothetical protein
MFRRLVVGLFLGVVIGGLAAAAIVAGLRLTTFDGAGGAAFAYLAAALTGVLTGLVAGKPIWAADAKIEAGLKAFFGALMGAGMMFALRRWAGGWVVDLSALGAGGKGAVGELPAASLPLIAGVLGVLLELDNTGGESSEKGLPQKRTRIAAAGRDGKASSRSVPDEEADGSDDADVVSKRAKR